MAAAAPPRRPANPLDPSYARRRVAQLLNLPAAVSLADPVTRVRNSVSGAQSMDLRRRIMRVRWMS
jgi:hypothetical protein